MAGMEGLGRLFNVVPIAAGKAISLRDCSAITYVCTGTDTFTLTVASTFAGSYATPGSIISRVYWTTATDGTTAWNKLTLAAASNAFINGTTTGLTTSINTVFSVFGSELADPKVYVKLTASGSGLVTAIVHDLTYARGPANLPKLGA